MRVPDISLTRHSLKSVRTVGFCYWHYDPAGCFMFAKWVWCRRTSEAEKYAQIFLDIFEDMTCTTLNFVIF